MLVCARLPLVLLVRRGACGAFCRLAFSAQRFFRESVALYAPAPADIDFPAKLARARAHLQLQQQLQQHTHTHTHASPLHAPLHVASLPRSLVTLARLYRCLEPPVFKYLAQEAVEVCPVHAHVHAHVHMDAAARVRSQ